MSVHGGSGAQVHGQEDQRAHGRRNVHAQLERVIVLAVEALLREVDGPIHGAKQLRDQPARHLLPVQEAQRLHRGRHLRGGHEWSPRRAAAPAACWLRARASTGAWWAMCVRAGGVLPSWVRAYPAYHGEDRRGRGGHGGTVFMCKPDISDRLDRKNFRVFESARAFTTPQGTGQAAQLCHGPGAGRQRGELARARAAAA